MPKPLRPFFSGIGKGRPSGALRSVLCSVSSMALGLEGCGNCLPGLRALGRGSALPVIGNRVLEVNRMVEALKPKEERPMRALVTGANGFLGQHVVGCTARPRR